MYRKTNWENSPYSLIKRFINDNRLFLEEIQVLGKDSNGKAVKRKVITESVFILYKETPNELIIRFWKNGDKWNELANASSNKLSAIFGLNCTINDDIQYCDYIFEKVSDSRLHLSHGIPKTNGTIIQVTEKISYDVSKVSHGLTIGNTGSGKSVWIEYKILVYAQMGAIIYVADPKSADLSLLKYVHGFEDRVVSEPNHIARVLREVTEIMETRYRQYFSEVSAFGKTFVDFNLPPVVLVFDEFAAFIKSADKKLSTECMSYLYSLILKGRAMGCFVEIILQRPDSSILDGALRDQLGCRTLLGTASKEATMMCFGSSSVEHKSISVKGGGYIKIDGQGEEKYFETPFMKDFDFIAELESIIYKRQ
ncbi:FtsK/SpoIIIE domain-containing protein [Enterococcus faecalis]|uniref:FtsK/SpoIIIE domain-containing protein n=2 Tax=Enterococcus TaxID=1350 RepID=UPI0021570E0D|nr:FtsK/SpoIIIE domain-containing protein [Enterococcus faecalis]